MSHDAFLSYSSRDSVIAHKACTALESNGIRCWMAPRNITPGVPWSEAIIDGIVNSRALVLIFSQGSNNSEQVKREVERAVSKGIPIITFRIDDATPSRFMEYYISSVHWLDARTSAPEQNLQRLTEALKRILHGTAVETKTPCSSVRVDPRKRRDRVGRRAEWWLFDPTGRGGLLAIATCAVIGIGLLGALGWILRPVAPIPQPTQAAVTGKSSPWIDSLNQHEKVSQAVGLVLGTFRLPRTDGSPGKKIAMGTGSAFAVTADGYLLTNEQVAGMGTSEGAKKYLADIYQTLIVDESREHNKSVDLINSSKKSLSREQIEGQMEKLKEHRARIEAFTKQIKTIEQKATDVEPKLTVFFSGVPLEAKIVHISDRFDMAILKVERRQQRPFFALSASNEVEQGSDVTVFGFPGIASEARSKEDVAIEKQNEELGMEPEKRFQPHHFRLSQSQGIVNRCIEDSRRTWSIEHQAPTFPGSSGSPIALANGVVVGIHSAGRVLDGGGKLNIALCVAQFRTEIDEFVPNGVSWVK